MNSFAEVFEKCKELTVASAKIGANYAVKAASYTAEKSKDIYHSEQVQRALEKLGEFYKDHK